jgi:uncharacterized membrane protein YoaK (UPF0700 family)
MCPTAHPDPAESLPAAILLATTGGLLDGFVYLNHGHVFANAMTGNVVLLGIDVLSKNYLQSLRHLAPLTAFFLGVATSRFVHSRLSARGINSARISACGLALEFVVLLAASMLPLSFPEMAFTGLIAYVSSFQITSFRRVGSLTYSSTFVTGNLRDMSVGLFELAAAATPEERSAGAQKARHLGLICLGFFVGVMTGAWCAPHLFNHTLWIADVLLVFVAVLLYRASRTRSAATN